MCNSLLVSGEILGTHHTRRAAPDLSRGVCHELRTTVNVAREIFTPPAEFRPPSHSFAISLSCTDSLWLAVQPCCACGRSAAQTIERNSPHAAALWHEYAHSNIGRIWEWDRPSSLPGPCVCFHKVESYFKSRKWRVLWWRGWRWLSCSCFSLVMESSWPNSQAKETSTLWCFACIAMPGPSLFFSLPHVWLKNRLSFPTWGNVLSLWYHASFSGSSVLNRVYNFTFLCLEEGPHRESSPVLPLQPHNFRRSRVLPLLKCVKTQVYVPTVLFRIRWCLL